MFCEDENTELEVVVAVDNQQGAESPRFIFSNKGKTIIKSRFDPVGPTSDCCQCFEIMLTKNKITGDYQPQFSFLFLLLSPQCEPEASPSFSCSTGWNNFFINQS